VQPTFFSRKKVCCALAFACYLVLRAAAQGGRPEGNAACLWCGHGRSGETGVPASGGVGDDPLRAKWRCQEKHGRHAEYDAEFSLCVCAEGYGPDQSEQCVIDLVQVMTWLWQQACASSQHAAVHRVPGYYRRFAR
jgi:hypothetical protein